MSLDIESILHNAVAAGRAERLKESPQLTLGELILKLEAVQDHDASVVFNFEYAFPTTLDSWRGAYCELALGFDFRGYGFGDIHKESKAPTVTELLKELKGAMGRTYEGWKGGDFVMGKTTPIWVANPGNSGNTGIVDVLDKKYEAVLITGYCEY